MSKMKKRAHEGIDTVASGLKDAADRPGGAATSAVDRGEHAVEEVASEARELVASAAAEARALARWAGDGVEDASAEIRKSAD